MFISWCLPLDIIASSAGIISVFVHSCVPVGKNSGYNTEHAKYIFGGINSSGRYPAETLNRRISVVVGIYFAAAVTDRCPLPNTSTVMGSQV